MRVFDPTRLGARLLWGGIAAVLALGIPFSFVMIGGATSSAEREARDRATRWATQTLPETLGNQIISKPIVDEDFRDVKAVVDSEILSDDRVLRVRIWNDAGLLVFSSFQRDKVGETVATGDDQVRRALDGQVVSVVSQSRGDGARQLESFVPIELGSGSDISAVVEIAEDYDAIGSKAAGIWRPLQLLFGLGALGCIVMLVRSERAAASAAPMWGTSARRVPPGADRASLERIRALERELKEAERRVEEADDRVASIERVKATLEQQLDTSGDLRDAEAARSAIDEDLRTATKRPEMDREMEREIAMLRETAARAPLLEKEIVTLRQTVASVPNIDQAGLDSLRDALRTANQDQAALAAQIEQLTVALVEKEAALKLASELQSDHPILVEAQQRLRETEERLAASDHRADQLERRLSEAEQRSATELEQPVKELERLRAMVAERETELQTVRTTLAERDQQLGQARESLATRAEELRRLETTVIERDEQLQRAHESLADLQREMQNVTHRLKQAGAATVEPAASEGESDVVKPAGRAERRAAKRPAASPDHEGPEEAMTPGPRVAASLHPSTPPAGSEVEDGEPLSQEGMSLRERLARAVAARNRVSSEAPEE